MVLSMPSIAQISPIAPVPPLESLQPGDIQIDIPPLARTIAFSGNSLISSAELQQASGLKSGQLINQEALDKAIDGIQNAYQDEGYIAAVTGIDLPKVGQVGTLTFKITELRISQIRFEGLRKVHEKAVRRVLSIKPGDIFSRMAVIQDSKQIQQLSVFDGIAPELEPTSQMGEAVLIWKLNEKEQFNYADWGGSYSPEDSLVGEINLTFGNVGGSARRLLVSGEMGSVESQAGGRVEFYNPWIAPNNTSLLLDAFSVPRYRFSHDLAVSGRYYERRSGFKAAVSKMPNPYLTLATGLRYENITAHNLPSTDFTDPTIQSGSLIMGSLKSTYDLRDSITTTDGTYTINQFECGWSDQDTGGNSMIGKLWSDRRWFVPLRETKDAANNPVPVLALRTLLAGSAGSLPYYEQYFVGGIGDFPLRGYVESRFWGKYAFLANAELRYPLSRSFGVVAFVDTGDAWGSEFQFVPGITTNYSQHKKFSPKAGAGVGIRYNSSYGPMSLDFAYGDDFRTYFSVGQLF